MNFINYIKNHKKLFGIIFISIILLLIILFLFFIYFKKPKKAEVTKSIVENSQINTQYTETVNSELDVNKNSEITDPKRLNSLVDTLKLVIFNDVFYSDIYYEKDICEYSDKYENSCIDTTNGICDYYLCWDGKIGLANTEERKINVTEKYKNFTKTIRTGSIERLYLRDSILIYKTPNYFKMSLLELQKMHSQTESGVLADVPTAFASPIYVDKDQILWSGYRCSMGWAPSDNDPESVKKNFEDCNLISDALDEIFGKKASN